MSNALTALNKEVWTRKMQEILEKELVAMAIANTDLRSLLNDGDTIHKPYRSNLKAQDYTKGTSVQIDDVTATDETLTVDTTKVVAFYIDDIDKIQNSYNTMMEFAQDSQHDLNQIIDRQVLAEYANADNFIDDGDIGGTAGNPAVISSTNINQVYSAAARKLTLQNVDLSSRFSVISPSVLEELVLYTSGKDTSFGDEVLDNGFVGKRFGFDIFVSNNLTSTATWTPADNPTDGDTLTIAGVVITFKSALTPAAGEVLIGGTVDVTLTNLAGLLNNPGTTDANQVALSYEDCVTLDGISATASATDIDVVFKGGGEVVYAASEVADVWSAETLHCLFGKKGATDLVIQKQPNIQVKDVEDKLGVNILAYTLFGIKTFDVGDKQLVDVRIDSSNF